MVAETMSGMFREPGIQPWFSHFLRVEGRALILDMHDKLTWRNLTGERDRAFILAAIRVFNDI